MLQWDLTLKLLLTVKQAEPAMVEILELSTNGLMTTDLFTHHASNMLRTIFKDVSVNQLMFAVSACGHHLQLAMTA